MTEAAMEFAVLDVLKNDAAIIAAGVAAKIFPEVLPQGEVTPAVIYELLSDVPFDDINGNASLYRAIIEYKILSTKRKDVADIGDKIRLALQGYRGEHLGVRIRGIHHLTGDSEFLPEIKNHVRTIMFSVLYHRENPDHDDS